MSCDPEDEFHYNDPENQMVSSKKSKFQPLTAREVEAPLGLPLAEFTKLAHDFKIICDKEVKAKPSAATYKAARIKNFKGQYTFANSTYALQFLMLLSDNGGYAERKGPNQVKFESLPNIKNSIKWLKDHIVTRSIDLQVERVAVTMKDELIETLTQQEEFDTIKAVENSNI